MVLLPRVHLPSLIAIQLDVVDRPKQRATQQRRRFRQWRRSQPLANIRLEQLDTLVDPVDGPHFLNQQPIHRYRYRHFDVGTSLKVDTVNTVDLI